LHKTWVGLPVIALKSRVSVLSASSTNDYPQCSKWKISRNGTLVQNIGAFREQYKRINHRCKKIAFTFF